MARARGVTNAEPVTTLTPLVPDAAGRPATVAGSISQRGHPVSPAVWESTDGRVWVQRALPEVPGSRYVAPAAVAARGTTRVAVGATGDAAQSRGVVWRSEGRGKWQRVGDDRLFGAEQWTTIDQVVAGEPGFVAVGTVGHGDTVRTRLWFSPNGSSWSQVRTDAVADHASIQAGAGGQGRIVLVGQTADAGGAEHPTAWSSTDGNHWRRSALPGASSDQYVDVEDVVSLGSRFFVGGGSGQRLLWTSSDGVRWTKVRTHFAKPGSTSVTPYFGSFDALASDGQRLYAVASYSFPPAVWTSTDGQSWSVLGDLEEGLASDALALDDVAVIGGRPVVQTDAPSLVAYGADRKWKDVTTDQRTFTMGDFTESADMVAAQGRSVVVVGDRTDQSADISSATGDHSAWLSTDGGVDYRRLDSPALSDTGADALVHNDRAFLYLGNGARDAPVLARSRDGRHWTRIGRDGQPAGNDATVLPSKANASLEALAPYGAGYVLGGSTYDSHGHTDPYVGISYGAPVRRVPVRSLRRAVPHLDDILELCASGQAIVALASSGGRSRYYPLISTDGGTTWRLARATDGTLPVGRSDYRADTCQGGPSGLLLEGAGPRDTGMWRWQGGNRFRAVRQPKVGGQTAFASDAVSLGDRWLVATWTTSGGALSSDGQLWLLDGDDHWTRIATGDSLRGLGSQDLQGIALAAGARGQPDRLVAAGGSTHFPVAWSTTLG